MRRLIPAALIALAAISPVFFAAPSRADDSATTRPAPPAASSGQMRPGPAMIIQRYKRAVGELDLTPDEKSVMDAVWNLANQQGLALSSQLGGSELQQRYQKLAAFARQVRKDLSAVLTDDQMKALDQKVPMGAAPGTGQRPGDAPRPGDSQRPTDAQRPGGGPYAGAMLDNVQKALTKLDLSDEQKQQVQDLMTDTRAKIAEIRKNAANGGNAQQDLQQLRQSVRDKLKSILTPQQMETFTQEMQHLIQQRGSRGGAATGDGSRLVDNKPLDLQDTGPQPGDKAPDVKIIETNGRAFSPSLYKGHVLVLEFGSMSCPVFRQHVQEMEKLKAADSARAFFMIVYTRENFPAGDNNVERNRDEGVSIAPATTLDERKQQALETQQELRITIPMAVDAMDDSVSKAFGTFPNGTVVIGKDGNIAARQQWTNPDTLKQMIDDAWRAPASPTATASAH